MGTSNLRTAPSGRCAACGKHVHRVQLDHTVPLWAGGPNDTANLSWICPPCHAIKTRRELRSPAYRRYLRSTRRRRAVRRVARGTVWTIIVVIVLTIALALLF